MDELIASPFTGKYFVLRGQSAWDGLPINLNLIVARRNAHEVDQMMSAEFVPRC